jgi:hypothetical protein
MHILLTCRFSSPSDMNKYNCFITSQSQTNIESEPDYFRRVEK